jgi:hypothetical protein
MLLLFGLPIVLGLMALWEWQPIAATAAVGVLVTLICAGVVALLRGREADSWAHALAAVLAVLAGGAVMLVLLDATTSAVLDALVWPVEQLSNGFE